MLSTNWNIHILWKLFNRNFWEEVSKETILILHRNNISKNEEEVLYALNEKVAQSGNVH